MARRSFRIRSPLAAATLLSAPMLLVLCGTVGAGTLTTWTNPLGGFWSTPANWDNGAPIDNTFEALIDLDGGGPGYTVTLDNDFTINNFSLLANNVTLSLFDGGISRALVIEGDFSQDGTSSIVGDELGSAQQGSMTVNGDAVFHGGRVGFLDQFNATGGLTFSAKSPIDIDDTDVDHSGTAATWSGGADINLNAGSLLTFGATSVLTISATGNIAQTNAGAASITSSGQIIKTSAGTTSIAASAISLVNNASGQIDVQNGTLATDGAFTNTGTLRVSNTASTFNVTGAGNFTNFAGGTLSGGTLDLKGTLQFNGADIVDIASDITLDGASAKIVDQSGTTDGLRNAAAVNSGGAFRIKNGANLTPAGDFDVDSGGTFDVGAGSKLTVKPGTTFSAAAGSTFANIAPTTTGGEILVQGVVRTPTTSITAIGSKLTLDGAGSAVTDLSGNNALGNVSTINSTGFLSVVNRPSFVTNAGVFNVNTGGHLTVGSGVTFDIPAGTLGNLSSATLDLGRFTLQGRIRTNLPAPGSIPALTMNNTTTLDGVGSSIFDITTNFDLFSRLSVIDTAGDLSLLNGRALSLTQPLTVRGRLFIGNTAAPRPDAGTGAGASKGGHTPGGTDRGAGTSETLQVEGDVVQEQGFTMFDTGGLSIVGASNAFKIQRGGLGGTGSVDGNTQLGGNLTGDTALIAPGKEGPCNYGALGLFGNLQLRSGSTLAFDIGTDPATGSTLLDTLTVSGNTFLDPGVIPEVNFNICDSFVPVLGAEYLVADMNIASAITFSFTGLTKPNGIVLTRIFASGDLYVRVTSVPGPGCLAVLAAGGVLGTRRRRA